MEKTSILAKSPRTVAITLPLLGRLDVSRVSVQRISLLLLVLQNSTLILTLHHARTAPVQSGPRYLSSTAVLVVEVVKLFSSLLIVAHETLQVEPGQSVFAAGRRAWHGLFSAGSLRLVIPAVLYTLQNTLVYVAISNLDAISFQVTYQLKILTTVLFSIALLGRVVTRRQWLSLVLLTVGVATVQVSGPFSSGGLSLDDIKEYLLSVMRPLDTLLPAADEPAVQPAATVSGAGNNMHGFLAVLGASLISGFTCVYFEKLMKDSLASVSVWTRNAQLAFFSIFPALFILLQDGSTIAEQGFFAGYTPLVWATVMLQALGGMIVAVCIAYADNVAKNFAASLSIVVSCAVTAMYQSPASLLVSSCTLHPPILATMSLLLIGTQVNRWNIYRALCCLFVPASRAPYPRRPSYRSRCHTRRLSQELRHDDDNRSAFCLATGRQLHHGLQLTILTTRVFHTYSTLQLHARSFTYSILAESQCHQNLNDGDSPDSLGMKA
ncbi:hypothetical protein GQ53DRAFT_360694 [Thozetella sp. PMI_491]|nr:hypothetical protein GQ53DRAFT_360694 [Thozetella sp. PMI_491]